MGLFKSKDERRMERDIKIRQGIRRIEGTASPNAVLSAREVARSTDCIRSDFSSSRSSAPRRLVSLSASRVANPQILPHRAATGLGLA